MKNIVSLVAERGEGRGGGDSSSIGLKICRE